MVFAPAEVTEQIQHSGIGGAFSEGSPAVCIVPDDSQGVDTFLANGIECPGTYPRHVSALQPNFTYENGGAHTIAKQKWSNVQSCQ